MSATPVINRVDAYATAAIALQIPRSEMMASFGKAVHELLDTLNAQGLAPSGPLVAYHHQLMPDRFDFEVAFPVSDHVNASGRVVASRVPAGTVAVAEHKGVYDNIADSWRALDAWLGAQGHEPAGDFWEVYTVGPEAGRDSSEWRTHLYRRLKD